MPIFRFLLGYFPHQTNAPSVLGKKIMATFTEFDITDSTECSSDYVVINTGYNHTTIIEWTY